MDQANIDASKQKTVELAGEAGREELSSSLLWMSSAMLATNTCTVEYGSSTY